MLVVDRQVEQERCDLHEVVEEQPEPESQQPMEAMLQLSAQ